LSPVIISKTGILRGLNVYILELNRSQASL
jgi:hypothetical protein